MEERPAGPGTPKTAHCPKWAVNLGGALRPVVLRGSDPGAAGPLPSAQRQAAWLLQLLQGGGQLRESGEVIPSCTAHLVLVAQRAKRGSKLQLAGLCRTTEALPCGETTDHTDITKPCCSWSAGLIAEASILEEPGAGVSHAGICAGAVGQLAVQPRYHLPDQITTPRAKISLTSKPYQIIPLALRQVPYQTPQPRRRFIIGLLWLQVRLQP